MSFSFFIACEVGFPKYLYWSGVTWTAEISKARNFETRKAGDRELKDLSPPRTARRGRVPQVLTFNPEDK